MLILNLNISVPSLQFILIERNVGSNSMFAWRMHLYRITKQFLRYRVCGQWSNLFNFG